VYNAVKSCSRNIYRYSVTGIAHQKNGYLTLRSNMSRKRSSFAIRNTNDPKGNLI
jgi:hypothetical protein